MQRSVTYTNERLGKVEVIPDFLPPPEDLVLRDEGVKVTLSLSRRSVEFFKTHAARAKVPFQRMIRGLLEAYADEYSRRPNARRRAVRRNGKKSRRKAST